MDDNIRKRVAGVIVKQLKIDAEKEILIGNDMPLIELGVGVDSVSTLELVIALENEFDLDIDESEVNSDVLHSLTTLTKYIESLSGG